MKKPNFRFIALAFMMTGVAALANNIAEPGERIVHFTNSVPPVWQESPTAHIVAEGVYLATGDSSVVLRLADEKRPLAVVFGSNDGWQVGGGLPRDVVELEGACPHAP